MKTQNIATIVKINPPRLASNIYLRKRLFKALDEARSRPVIWIAAPGGAGKTTLVTSYLKEKNLPCIWYQIDPGDGDIASFFHYMGLAVKNAAPRYKRPLPHLTPEYLAGLPAFTRNYFRELFSRVNQAVSKRSLRGARRGSNLNKGIATHTSGARNDRFVIVFDNYQEAPENSQLHEIMLNGLSEIPEGINVIIIGRLPLPPAMSRMQVSETLSLLNWNDISLTLEESIGIGRLRTKGKGLNNEVLEALHKQTQGWVAGLILLLEQAECNITPQMLKDQLNQQTVFDYFAGEIFQRANKGTQEFLLKTSFLPRIAVSAAALLTGRKDAADILNTLVRRNYFTIRHAGAEGVFEYHPLFRAFLENRLDHTLNNKELAELKNKAARLLIKADNIEDAVPLLQQTEDWQTLTSLILQQAPQLAQQGRLQTLTEWLQSLPDSVCKEEPWMLYWLGVCGLPFSPSAAREHLEKAYTLFKIQQDGVGIFLSWSGVVKTLLLSGENYTALDHWLTLLEELTGDGAAFPSPQIELQVTSSIFNALIHRRLYHSHIGIWVERAYSILQKTDLDAVIRIEIGAVLLHYHLWTGEFSKATFVINVIHNIGLTQKLPPLILLRVKASEAFYNWVVLADEAASLRVVKEALKLSEESGVHIFDFSLLGQGIAAALSDGDLATADEFLHKMEATLGSGRSIDKGFYHYLSCWQALLRNDCTKASVHLHIGEEIASKLGFHYGEVLYNLGMAQYLHECGNNIKTAEHLSHTFEIGRQINSRMVEFMMLLFKAYFAIDCGQETEGLKPLREALAIGREYGYINHLWWRPDVMSLLCAKALEHGIEVEYVQSLIRKRSLIPEEPPLHLDNYPWAVKIYTLGRFNVVRDSKPLSLSAPSSHKPFELLSALIAFGGRMISKEMLIEALWPDAEGDVAQQNFETTLHRLRKLLGSDEALVLKDGRLTLDDRCCWVDCWAFERLITQLEHLLGTADAKPDEAADEIAGEIDIIAKKIFDLYHGHFLGREPDYSWSLTLRERLRSRFLRYIRDMSRYWKSHEKLDEAVEYYIKGLEIDPVSEGLYYGLMQCYIELGDFAEALSIYKRCCYTLKTLLNTTPSPKIEAIYHSIRHDKTPKQEDRTSQ